MLALAPAVVILAACGPARRSDRPHLVRDRYTITADQIARLSGANDAWEVLRRSGIPITLLQESNGQPVRVRSRRGRNSIVLRGTDSPVIVVDGNRTNDPTTLRSIPANLIVYMRLYGAIDGTTAQGTGATGGVLEIQTRAHP